ncbi:MAG: glycosyltransferase family 2 protein [Planctomycetota bacterium]
MSFKPAALIGIYNHGDTIADVVEPLCAQALPTLIVDDGSDEHTRAKLDLLARRFPGVRVKHLSVNRGKGAALIHGFELLAREGFTHAVVLDADKQHDTGDVEKFLAAARADPRALILGRPIFDASAPKARLYGRKLSTFWVHVATLSFAIADPLCGFRCYPLAATNDVVRSYEPRTRMDFDPEIAVRLAWSGVPMVNVATKVVYPKGGISHFDYLRDNRRITWMHIRLVVGMLLRAPRLLASRARRAQEARA